MNKQETKNVEMQKKKGNKNMALDRKIDFKHGFKDSNTDYRT